MNRGHGNWVRIRQMAGFVARHLTRRPSAGMRSLPALRRIGTEEVKNAGRKEGRKRGRKEERKEERKEKRKEEVKEEGSEGRKQCGMKGHTP